MTHKQKLKITYTLYGTGLLMGLYGVIHFNPLIILSGLIPVYSGMLLLILIPYKR